MLSQLIIGLMVWFAASLTPITQTQLHATYISDDGTFSFHYADTLAVTVQPIQAGLRIGEFFVSDQDPVRVVVSPPMSAQTFRANGVGETPEAIVAARLALWRQVVPTRSAEVLSFEPVLPFQEAPPPVNAYTINGRPAAYAMQIFGLDANHAAAIILLAIDVGQGHIVTITASPSLLGGEQILSDVRDDVLAIAETLTFVPLLNTDQNDALPLASTFSAEIGTLQTGDLLFYYPKSWYILPVGGNIFITNVDRLLTDGNLEPGIVQVNVIPPDFNLTGFADIEQIEACAPLTTQPISAATVLETQMLTPERIASYEQEEATYFPPESVMLNGRDAAYMRVFTPQRDVLVIAVNMGEGRVVSLMSFSASGKMATYDDTLFALAATLDYHHIGCEE
jgi:hypothetical protein